MAARRRSQPPPFEVTVEKVRPEKEGGKGGEKYDGQYGFNNPGKVNA